MLTQESLFLTRVLGKKSWPKKGCGRRGILWKIHGNPWRIRENPWNINGKSVEIYGESAEIHWKSLENLWKSIIKQALFGYSLLAMVPTFAACASFARGLTFATGPTGSNLCNRSENEIQCNKIWKATLTHIANKCRSYNAWCNFIFLAPPTGLDHGLSQIITCCKKAKMLPGLHPTTRRLEY